MRSICVHSAHSERFFDARRCNGGRERGFVSVFLQAHQTGRPFVHDTLRAASPQEL
jgi:hypothetical protein